MTRLQATIKLLAHGELPFAEFVSITGWHYRQCQRALAELQDRGRVVQRKRAVWALVQS